MHVCAGQRRVLLRSVVVHVADGADLHIVSIVVRQLRLRRTVVVVHIVYIVGVVVVVVIVVVVVVDVRLLVVRLKVAV